MAERDAVSTVTSNVSVLPKIQDVLDLAQREIHRGNTGLALRLLRNIRHEADQQKGTKPWAEHKVRIAEAFAAQSVTNDVTAVDFFEEALECIKCLVEPDPELEMHAHESYGNYLVGTLGRRAKARIHFEISEGIAVRLRLDARIAEIKLKIIKLDLEIDKDAEIKNFEVMKQAAKEGEFTWGEQLAAWYQYSGNTEQARQGMRFARHEHFASKAFFHSLLESVRVSLNE